MFGQNTTVDLPGNSGLTCAFAVLDGAGGWGKGPPRPDPGV